MKTILLALALLLSITTIHAEEYEFSGPKSKTEPLLDDIKQVELKLPVKTKLGRTTAFYDKMVLTNIRCQFKDGSDSRRIQIVKLYLNNKPIPGEFCYTTFEDSFEVRGELPKSYYDPSRGYGSIVGDNYYYYRDFKVEFGNNEKYDDVKKFIHKVKL